MAELDFGHLNAFEKIEIGGEFFILDCLLSSSSPDTEPITDEEAMAIGLLAAVRLYQFRGKLHVQ